MQRTVHLPNYTFRWEGLSLHWRLCPDVTMRKRYSLLRIYLAGCNYTSRNITELLRQCTRLNHSDRGSGVEEAAVGLKEAGRRLAPLRRRRSPPGSPGAHPPPAIMQPQPARASSLEPSAVRRAPRALTADARRPGKDSLPPRLPAPATRPGADAAPRHDGRVAVRPPKGRRLGPICASPRCSAPRNRYPARRMSSRFGSFQFGLGKWQV